MLKMRIKKCLAFKQFDIVNVRHLNYFVDIGRTQLTPAHYIVTTNPARLPIISA